MAVSFIGGRNRSTRRKPPTCRRSLTNFITKRSWGKSVSYMLYTCNSWIWNVLITRTKKNQLRNQCKINHLNLGSFTMFKFIHPCSLLPFLSFTFLHIYYFIAGWTAGKEIGTSFSVCKRTSAYWAWQINTRRTFRTYTVRSTKYLHFIYKTVPAHNEFYLVWRDRGWPVAIKFKFSDPIYNIHFVPGQTMISSHLSSPKMALI